MVDTLSRSKFHSFTRNLTILFIRGVGSESRHLVHAGTLGKGWKHPECLLNALFLFYGQNRFTQNPDNYQTTSEVSPHTLRVSFPEFRFQREFIVHVIKYKNNLEHNKENLSTTNSHSQHFSHQVVQRAKKAFNWGFYYLIVYFFSLLFSFLFFFLLNGNITREHVIRAECSPLLKSPLYLIIQGSNFRACRTD